MDYSRTVWTSCLVAAIAFVAFGCAATKPVVSTPPLPPAPKALAKPKAFTAPITPATIVVSWRNYPNAWASNIVTGLEVSTDLRHWQEAVVLPYAESNRVFRTATSPTEQYRAFNRIKQ